MSIRIRRGTDAQRLTVVLQDGEVAWTTDTQEFYVGDGVTLGGIFIGPSTGAFVPLTRNITINGTTQDLSVDRTWSVGTVTSVGLALPTEFAISGSPVTGAGTLTGSWNAQSANTVLAGPTSGGAATPTFRALVSGDIPDISATYLTVANAALNYQPLDSDLTTIAGLTPADDDIIQRKAGAWTNRSIAQYYADLQPSVKDDVYFTIHFNSANQNPADGVTYYFGAPFTLAPGTGATARRWYVPVDCTLIGYAAHIVWNVGTSEQSELYFRINNTTDVAISTTIAGNALFNAYSSALNTNLSAGDLINCKLVCPTWATNPTAMTISVLGLFKRR